MLIHEYKLHLYYKYKYVSQYRINNIQHKSTADLEMLLKFSLCASLSISISLYPSLSRSL